MLVRNSGEESKAKELEEADVLEMLANITSHLQEFPSKRKELITSEAIETLITIAQRPPNHLISTQTRRSLGWALAHLSSSPVPECLELDKRGILQVFFGFVGEDDPYLIDIVRA